MDTLLQIKLKFQRKFQGSDIVDIDIIDVQ
jgi:hypothetical protein